MKIVNKNVDELIPYINNPRLNDNAVDAVASSIKNFGFKVPCVIDKNGVIVAGHRGSQGDVFLTIMKVGITQVPTQQSKGGLTEAYLDK